MIKRVRGGKIVVAASDADVANGRRELPREWLVCLDTASYSTTSPLSLSCLKPDFAVMSFYKLFGFPTSLGALLIRKTDNVRASLAHKRSL